MSLAAPAPERAVRIERTLAQRVRRIMVWVIVVSFGLAALSGIVVLLGGDLGETAARVIATTALVGAFSVAVLCCLSLVGRRLQVFGFVGAAASVLTLALCLVMLWGDDLRFDDAVFRWLWTGVAATAAFSLASLLLLLADRRRAAVRIGLAITLALFAVVLALVWYLIWWSNTIDNEVFARVLGIAGILAALGGVVVPVLSLLLRDASVGSAGAASAAVDAASLPMAQISPELAQRLAAEAARRGVSVDELVAPLLDAGPYSSS